MDARTSEPASVVDQMLARCRTLHTPCGKGRMVWRVWGKGAPVVLLHGGSGSWTHWIRNIAALAARYRIYVADLPGLGDSDEPLGRYDPDDQAASTDQVAEIVVAGLREILPPPARYHLVGFSYGAVCGGSVAARDADRIVAFTMIGASALGVPWPGLSGSLRVIEEGMTEAQVLDVQRHNLQVIMLATPASQIDDFAARLQLENTRRSRIRTHTVAPTDVLIRALRRSSMPLVAIWGREDAFLPPGPENTERVLRALPRDVTVHLIDDAGHWAMYEAPDAVNALLLSTLATHAVPDSLSTQN